MRITKTYAYLLSLITAATIFFQFHLALPTGVININLADPFALLALMTLGLNALLSKKMPQWRVPEFNYMLISFGALLLFSYVIGWMKIGSTQWALSSRLIGWLVLLGYLSAGYLLVAYVGNKGVRRFLEVLATAAIFVIGWHVAVRLLYGYGFEVPKPTLNFEGFSGNRNAFAFQLLAVLALSLPYSRVYARHFRGRGGILRSEILVGLLISGIFWSASRAGILVAAIMLLVAYCQQTLDRRSTLYSVIFAMLLWGIVWTLQNLEPNFPNVTVQSFISSAESNHERWAINCYGLEMWRHSPLIGEGLGVFIASTPERFGHSTVIHNTPIWILAEFGLLGAVVLGWFCLKLVLYATKSSSFNDRLQRSALLLLLLLFIVFSQFHEMLFQRIFWLIGGVLLGMPLVIRFETQVKIG